MTYKYESAHDWLETKAMDPAFAVELLNAIIPTLDADTIQNLFQNEMEADGYFDEESDDEDDQDEEWEDDEDE